MLPVEYTHVKSEFLIQNQFLALALSGKRGSACWRVAARKPALCAAAGVWSAAGAAAGSERRGCGASRKRPRFEACALGNKGRAANFRLLLRLGRVRLRSAAARLVQTSLRSPIARRRHPQGRCKFESRFSSQEPDKNLEFCSVIYIFFNSKCTS